MHAFLCRKLRSLFRILVIGLLLIGGGLAPAAGSERRPKIRAITAFVRIDSTQYRQQLEEAVTVLRQAKTAFERSGYEVQTIRITTQAFTQYLGSRSAGEALDFFKRLDDLSKRESFMLNLGPLTLADSSDAAKVELLSRVLAQTRANASLVVADEDGVSWGAIRSAGQVIKYVEEHSPNGTNNFDFAAVAMVPPSVPFFPASNHYGAGHEFSVGWEAGAFVGDVLAGANRDMKEAKELLSRGVRSSRHGRWMPLPHKSRRTPDGNSWVLIPHPPR